MISTGYHVLTIDADSLPLDVQLWDALSGRCLRTSSLSGPVSAIDEFDTKASDMMDRLESGGGDSVADECTSIACHLIVPRRPFAPGDDPTPFRPPAVVMTTDKPQRVVQRKGKYASFCENHRPAAVSRGTSGKLAMSRSATSRNLLSTLADAAPLATSGNDAQDQAAEEYGYLMDSDCGVGDAALGIVAKTKPPVTAEATNARGSNDTDTDEETDAASAAAIDDWLIVGGEDCLLRVMNIATGKIVRVLEGHYQTITSLALVASDVDVTKKRRFSHLVVLSASADMTIRAWDVLRGTTLATLSGHHSSIRCLSVLPPESLPEDSRSSSPLDTTATKGSIGGGTSKWDDEGNKIEAYVVSGSEGGSLRLWALRRTVKPRTSSSFTAYRVSNNFYDPSNYTDDDSDDDDSSRDSSHDGGYHHNDNPFAEPPPPRHLTKEERRRYGKCECLASIDNGHVESITCLHTIAVHSGTAVATAVAASVAPVSLQALSRSQASLTSLLNAPTSSGTSQTSGAAPAPSTQHHSVSVISGSEDTTLRVWSVRTMLAEYDYEYCLLLQGHRAKINFTLPVTLPPPQSLFGSLTGSSKTVMGGESPRPILSGESVLPSTFPVEVSCSAKTASRLLTATSSSFYFHQQQQQQQQQPPSLSLQQLQASQQSHYLHPHPSAALAPSGLLAGQQVILSGSDDGTMVLWDVHSGDALHTLHGHIDSVQCALVLDQIEYSPATTALLNDHSEASTTDIDAPAAAATTVVGDLEPHRHHVLVSGGSRGVLYTWAWS